MSIWKQELILRALRRLKWSNRIALVRNQFWFPYVIHACTVWGRTASEAFARECDCLPMARADTIREWKSMHVKNTPGVNETSRSYGKL